MATPGMDPQHLAREDLEAHPDRLRGLQQCSAPHLIDAGRCLAGRDPPPRPSSRAPSGHDRS